MRARFIGDPKRGGGGPRVLRLFGLVFTHSQWVSIDSLEPFLQTKLKGNNHFQVDDGKAAAPPASPAPAAQAEATAAPVKNKGGRPRKNPVNAPAPVPDAEQPLEIEPIREVDDDDGFSDREA